MFDLTARVALVTGGGSGIGRGIARGLAGAGSRVVVADIDVESARSTVARIEAEGGRASAVQMDVTRSAMVEEVVQGVLRDGGAVDILVNSAGIAIKGTALDYAEEDWDRIIAVNLKGTFLPMQVVGRHMAARGSGKIINIASIGSFVAYPGSMAYLASKGGVAQLTKSFALELAPRNVQVNAIAPCLMDTPMTTKVRSDTADYFIDRTPMGRMGRTEELVGAAIYLASEASSLVTGHILAVDGGFLIA